jgi:hypothetical protein
MVRRALLFCTLVLGVLVQHVQPASAAQFQVYHWNMSGWKIQDLWGRPAQQGQGYQAVAMQAEAKILVHDPLVVTLNEVCSNQYNYLVSALNGMGYVSVTYTARVDVDGPNLQRCDWYGNAVFAKGVHFGSLVSHQFAAAASHSTVEKKGLVCRRVYLLGGTYVPCTAHTWPSDSEAAPQSSEAYGVVDYYYSGSARIMGGDLNLAEAVHRSSSLSNWFSVYNEGDDGPSGHPVDNEYTIYGGEKIDYIFANGGSYDRVDGNAVTPERWSDHWHLYGWFDG